MWSSKRSPETEGIRSFPTGRRPGEPTATPDLNEDRNGTWMVPGGGFGLYQTSEASLRSPRFSASSPEDRNVDSSRPGFFQPMSRQYLNKDDTLAIVRI